MCLAQILDICTSSSSGAQILFEKTFCGPETRPIRALYVTTKLDGADNQVFDDFMICSNRCEYSCRLETDGRIHTTCY